VFSPDAQLVATGSHNGDINFYNVESGEKVNSLSTKNKFLMSTAYVSTINRLLIKT
jgi:WD repeat-containing protein 61